VNVAREVSPTFRLKVVSSLQEKTRESGRGGAGERALAHERRRAGKRKKEGEDRGRSPAIGKKVAYLSEDHERQTKPPKRQRCVGSFLYVSFVR